MKTSFSNKDFLYQLTPNLDEIKKLKIQRNIFIGVSVVASMALVVMAYHRNKISERVRLLESDLKNKQPIKTVETNIIYPNGASSLK